MEYSPNSPCRLYIISPAKIELESFLPELKEALKAGDVGAFQLRLKDASDEEIRSCAKAILPICKEYGAAFIINDRADIAADIGADGVHLGQDDMSVAEARTIIGGDCVIGVSCHDSAHQAMNAGEQGADYVAFGAFYPTKSKDPEKLAKYGTPSLELLKWWYTYTTLPCVAIGGMTAENCKPMVESGADFVAAITSIWEHEKGAAFAIKEFNISIKDSIQKRPEILDSQTA